MKLDTRAYGDNLEKFVMLLFEKFGLKLKQFNNSGAENKNDSDLHDSKLQIECKRTSSADPKIRIPDWKQLGKEARARNKRPALIVSGHDMQKAVVVLRLVDFVKIYNGYIEDLEITKKVSKSIEELKMCDLD